VDDLHARAPTRVARVGVADELGPLLGGVLEALGAGLVGAEGGRVALRAGEARERYARVGGAGLEDVRVGARHHVGHHGARRGAHDEHLGRVAVVLGQRVVHHADDSQGVARAAVRERAWVLYVPAVAVAGGLRVDDDEALAVGVGWELSARVPLSAGSAARVKLRRYVSVPVSYPAMPTPRRQSALYIQLQ